MKITMDMSGLEKLQRELKEMQTAVNSLDGEIAKIHFTPGDPESVELAVSEMKQAVDQKASRYRSNPIVKAFAEASKKAFEKHLREQTPKQD